MDPEAFNNLLRTNIDKEYYQLIHSCYYRSPELQHSLEYAERDEQGTFYGYKVLWVCGECEEQGKFVLKSPLYQEHWDDGKLESDMLPGEGHPKGIHFVKSIMDSNLFDYYLAMRARGHTTFIVRCALSGVVIETERGFRAQYAQIVGVLDNGNWRSYQEMERAHSRPRRNPETEWRYIGWDRGRGNGDWVTNTGS
jgi:hypothetical protein